MLFSNINVNNVLFEFEPISDDLPSIENNEQFSTDHRDRIASHNIKTLYHCHTKKVRYRIRHGNYLGKKVAIVVVAETFMDKLFSYIPSGCLLKRRLSKPLKECLRSERCIKMMTMIFLRSGGKIPGMSPADVSSSCVYNPWPNLPETLNSTHEDCVKKLSPQDLSSGQAISFYHMVAANNIFSNMTRREDEKPLALVEMPGVVTTAPCSEILFQAGKYHNSPSIRKAILKKTCGTDAYTIAQKKDSNREYVYKADDGFYDEGRDIALMLKLVRTRAQQDDEFIIALLGTDTRTIYKITPDDKKWGCVKATSSTTGDVCYIGRNLLGRILMQVREEVKNGLIPTKYVEDVIRDRDIQRPDEENSDEENSVEEDFHSNINTDYNSYDYSCTADGYI